MVRTSHPVLLVVALGMVSVTAGSLALLAPGGLVPAWAAVGACAGLALSGST